MNSENPKINLLNEFLPLKRLVLTLAMMLALPAFLLCQTNGKNADKKRGDGEQAVRQMLNELSTALGKNDIAALDRIYADGYTFVGDTGVLTTKAQRLAAFKSGELRYESVSFDNITVRIFGDTAIATFGVTSKFAPGVKSVGGKFFTTATFVKSKGRWTEVAAQSTRVGD